jgi:hypothetical protein
MNSAPVMPAKTPPMIATAALTVDLYSFAHPTSSEVGLPHMALGVIV